MTVIVRPTNAEAAKLKGRADRLGRELLMDKTGTRVKTAFYDGFIIRAVKSGGRVIVDILEAPGRFEGSNQFRATDGLIGESSIDGVVVSTAPTKDHMSPVTPAVIDVPLESRKGTLGTVQAFGDPLPDDPLLLYNSFPTEIAGGVIFVHVYTDTAPPTDVFGDYVITDQPVWLVVLVRWAGLSKSRSVSFSEAYIQGLSGQGFYPRHVVYEGAPIIPIRYGARLPVAHYHDRRLSVAIELESTGGGLSTVGGMLALGIHYPNDVATLEWSEVLGPGALGPDLESDVFTGEAGDFQSAGFDLPAVFSWTDNTGADPVPTTVVSFRARCRKAVPGAYRLVTGQALLTVVDGAGSVDLDFLDSVAGADVGLPQIDAAKVYIQKYRDDLFLDDLGLLVRHRRMRVLTRPALDSSIPPAAPTTLVINTDIALLRTEHGGGIVNQTQSVLGYGPEEEPAGASAPNGGNGIENIGFSTPVGVGEVWAWGFINGSSAAQIGIARITTAGVGAPLASGIPRSLRLSTYQQEVRDEFGVVIVPMAQVGTILDAGEPKIAIKKGRFGALDFIPAASYSRFGTFYTASAISSPLYGRIFG